MALCLWPVLAVIARERAWEQVVELLLDADLPVAVYDLAIDVLYLRPAEREPAHGRPWRSAGFVNRQALVAAMRAEGYTGPTSYRMPALWSLYRGLRDGLAGPGIDGG